MAIPLCIGSPLLVQAFLTVDLGRLLLSDKARSGEGHLVQCALVEIVLCQSLILLRADVLKAETPNTSGRCSSGSCPSLLATSTGVAGGSNSRSAALARAVITTAPHKSRAEVPLALATEDRQDNAFLIFCL